jgi:hypothetical protein
MTESAAEHGVETTKVQFDLPVLHPDAPGEFPFRQSVQHVQHMLNEFDRDIGAEVLLNKKDNTAPRRQQGSRSSRRTTAFLSHTGQWETVPGLSCCNSGCQCLRETCKVALLA